MRKRYFPNRGFWLIAIFSLTILSTSFSIGNHSIILNDGTKIAMCDNVTSGGLIQGSETGCPDPEFDPAIITNVTLPSGGTGDLEYLWIFTTGDPNAPVTSWFPIPNSNTPDYDPEPITVETHYMRCARRFECDEYAGESNFVTKSLECCDNVTDGGTIDSDQLICDIEFDPDPITNSISPNGGTGNLEYQWYMDTSGSPFDINNPLWVAIPGATSESFDPGILTLTTFYIRVARREGCADFVGVSNIVTLTVCEGPKIERTTLTDVTCFGGNDGSIELLLSACTGFLIFEWSNNLFPVPNQTNLEAGTYAVTISDINGCEIREQFEITQPDEIVLETGFDFENCEPNIGATAYVTVRSGAQGAVSYLWNDSNNSTTDTITGIPAGNYEVTVMDSLGCFGSESVEVIMTDPLSLNIIETPATCAGENSGVLEAIATGGSGSYTYVWNDLNNTRGATLGGIPGGNFFVTVTDSNGCDLVGNANLPIPTEISIDINTTDGGCDTDLGTATALASGGVGTINYLWSNGQMTATAVDLAAGSYTVTATDENGCSQIANATIQNNSNFSISLFSEDMNCIAGSTGTAWVVPNGGVPPYTYLWSNMVPNDTIFNLSGGIFEVTVMDDTGCQRVGDISINMITPFEVEIFNTNNNCLGDETASFWVEVTGGAEPYIYNWSNGAQTDSIFNLASGLYTVTITDQNGCQEIIQEEITTFSNLTGTISHTNILCAGRSNGTAEFSATGGSGNIDYLWSNNETTFQIQGLQPGNYSVTATDALGCEISGAVTVLEPDDLICEVTINSVVTTYNGTEGSLAGTASGGTGMLRYEWSTNSNDTQINNLGSGLYALTVTDENDCQCTQMVSLENPSKIEGFAWNDSNGNGIQDFGENGLANVSVTLTGMDTNGQPVNLTVQTNSSGVYIFDGLLTGNYKLTFSEPTNFSFTGQDVGSNDNIDSDANTVTGMTINFTLGVSSVQTFDAGYTMANSSIDIGDFVWFDTDRDGNQDFIETGVRNFRVLLKNATTGATLRTTTTNLSGFYQFNNVLPGDYYIEFDPISLLAGHQFTVQDATNDNQDSDADVNGKTDVFTIVANQNDDFSFDAGVHGMCDNVTNGGTIGDDEALCGGGADPAEITSTSPPSGGVGTIEYLWLSSFTPVYTGQGDPNWAPIPNSNSISYDPEPILATTYYIRCARREGCTDFPGESNTIKKEILPSPNAQIDNPPTSVCDKDPTTFSAVSLGGGTSYSWSFRGGATPSSAGGRVVNGVLWAIPSEKMVILTTTRFGCSANDTAFVEVLNCPTPLGKFEDEKVETIGNVFTKISWNTTTNDENTFFDLEKSYDNNVFKRIKTINGNDDMNRSDYIYSDYEIEEGMAYYRIKHYNRNGAALFSNILEIENVFEENSLDIRIYPNPTTGLLILDSGDSDLGKGNFNIYDTKGILLLEKNIEVFSGENRILVSELPNGIYIIQSQTNPSLVSKFVIQR